MKAVAQYSDIKSKQFLWHCTFASQSFVWYDKKTLRSAVMHRKIRHATHRTLVFPV